MRYCRSRGFRVHLLEWTRPSRANRNAGLAEYADQSIGEAVATIAKASSGVQPRPFIHAMPEGSVCLIEHAGEVGLGLQHLAILAGRQAHAQVWPKIVSWLQAGG